MADVRDRVTLPAPILRIPFVNGWYVEHDVRFDLADRKVYGHIRFYDATGAFVRSEPFEARVTVGRRDNFVADIVADIVATKPELAGTLTKETVPNVDDPVASP